MNKPYIIFMLSRLFKGSKARPKPRNVDRQFFPTEDYLFPSVLNSDSGSVDTDLSANVHPVLNSVLVEGYNSSGTRLFQIPILINSTYFTMATSTSLHSEGVVNFPVFEIYYENGIGYFNFLQTSYDGDYQRYQGRYYYVPDHSQTISWNVPPYYYKLIFQSNNLSSLWTDEIMFTINSPLSLKSPSTSYDETVTLLSTSAPTSASSSYSWVFPTLPDDSSGEIDIDI